MTPDMDDDIRLENIAQIFIERQVLMMGRDDIRTVKAVRVCLPAALRLRADEYISEQETGNDEVAGIGHHRLAGRLSPAGQSFQIQCLELPLELVKGGR